MSHQHSARIKAESDRARTCFAMELQTDSTLLRHGLWLLAGHHRVPHVLCRSRLRAIADMLLHSASRRSGSLVIHYPPTPWYVENADALLAVLVTTARQLEAALGLTLPPVHCYVVQPEIIETIEGVAGVAYRDLVICGVPARHLSELAGIAAHELAHVLSHHLGAYDTPFKGEGFACYAAALIGADYMPMGMPVHFHPAWLRSVGVRLSLSDLWVRRDATPELYDLAWSFATFLAERFGRERYYAFYRSGERELTGRIRSSLGLSLDQLEREWLRVAGNQATLAPSQIARRHRCDGVVCSRADWLRRQPTRFTTR